MDETIRGQILGAFVKEPLETPKFSIPEDPNIELWTFRLPIHVPVAALNGVKMSIDDSESKGGKAVATFEHQEKRYQVRLGGSEENESFRALVPRDRSTEASDEDSSDSENEYDKATNIDDVVDKRFNLQPSKKSFSRHFSILTEFPEWTETQLAPRENPPLKSGTTMKHAYESVPQKSGLKRRWMPLGVSKACLEDVNKAIKANEKKTNKSKKIKKEEESEDEQVSTPPPSKRIKIEKGSAAKTASSKKEKKSSKKEKKSAKKASKKESKKSHKKIKKERANSSSDEE